MPKATERIYHRHPTDGYEVLVAVPGQEVSEEDVKRNVRKTSKAPAERRTHKA